jgi:hypothetical protein
VTKLHVVLPNAWKCLTFAPLSLPVLFSAFLCVPLRLRVESS